MEPQNIDLTTPNSHARWHVLGINKFLPANLDAQSMAIWDNFAEWSDRVQTVEDITRFEQEMKLRFLANPTLEKA